MTEQVQQPEPTPLEVTLLEDKTLGGGDLVMRTEWVKFPEGYLIRTMLFGQSATTQISPAVAMVFVTTAYEQPPPA